MLTRCLKLPGGAKQLVAAYDEFGIFGHEDFAGAAKIELRRMVAEILAVHARPNQTPIGIYVDFTDTEFSSGQILIWVYAFAPFNAAAGGVNAVYLLLGHSGGAVHNERKTGEPFLNFCKAVKTDGLGTGELIGAVAGSDGTGQRVAAGSLHELVGLIGVGKAGVLFIYLHIFLNAAQHSQFRFHRDAAPVGRFHHPPGDLHVLLKRMMRGINHHRGVEAAFDTVVGGLFVAMIEVNGEERFGEYLIRCTNNGFEHPFIGIRASPFADLDDERSLRYDAAAEKPHSLFKVVDVVGAKGIFAIGVLKQHFCWNDHELGILL